MNLKGRIKLVEIDKMLDGMQVIYQGDTIAKLVGTDGGIFIAFEHIDRYRVSGPELKTVVVEFFDCCGLCSANGYECTGKNVQIPLNYSQWQYAFDNLGDDIFNIDIEFNRRIVFNGDIKKPTVIAQMISFNKTSYTEKQIQTMIDKALSESFDGWSDEAIYGYKIAMQSIIHRLNN